jgi:phosphate-selective porin OprO/OprP
MKNERIFVFLLALISVLIVTTIPAKADQTEKLIEILVEKGVVTNEEAKELEDEMKEESQEEAKAEASSGGDWTDKVEVGYKKGAYIKTKDDNYLLKLNVRVQGFYAYQGREDREDTSTFRVRRARLLASGNAVYPWMKYGTQITLEGDSASLRDAWIESAYFDYSKIRLGQYKVPFDREFLTSGFSLQLIDRSIANDEFSLRRDIGLQFAGNLFQDRFNYAVGMFNGSGANQSNQNNDFMYVGRMVYMPFGSYPYSQGALDTPDRSKLAIGLAGAYLPSLEPGERDSLAGRLGNTNIVSVTSDVYELTADVAFKYQNISFEGGYYFRNIDPEEPTPFGEQDADGFYLQLGYFFIPKKFEVAARYSWADPDNPNTIENNEQTEYTAGLSYYISGHDLKLQANYSLYTIETPDKDIDDHVVQAQVTLAF